MRSPRYRYSARPQFAARSRTHTRGGEHVARPRRIVGRVQKLPWNRVFEHVALAVLRWTPVGRPSRRAIWPTSVVAVRSRNPLMPLGTRTVAAPPPEAIPGMPLRQTGRMDGANQKSDRLRYESLYS